MSALKTIPIVDFQNYSINIDRGGISAEILESLGEQVCGAFKDIGFVYLTNHGISQKQIDAVSACMKDFVSLPTTVKSKYTNSAKKHGWTQMGSEKLDPMKPPDIKEAYSFIAQLEQSHPSLDVDLPGFSETMRQMYNDCYDLAQHVLHVMGVGLHLKDVDYFCKQHSRHTKANRSNLKSSFYSPIPAKQEIRPGQLRCGEHSDWGTITLLFQDNAGGLQVKTRDGEFVHAQPISGTVLINIGDIMQRWTEDQLVSTVHRVMLPENPSVPRQSIAFFANPDDDCQVITQKYPTVVYKDYIDMKIKESRYV